MSEHCEAGMNEMREMRLAVQRVVAEGLELCRRLIRLEVTNISTGGAY